MTTVQKTALRELIEDASMKIEIYRNPDLSEHRPTINRLLRAGGMKPVGQDKIESIEITTEYVTIQWTHVHRYTPQFRTEGFPASILDEAKPFEAIALWARQQERSRLALEVKRTRAAHEAAVAAYEAFVSNEP